MSLLLCVHILQAVRESLGRRAREFGLLRMRGYSTADIRRLVTLEVGAGVAAGALVGVVLGSGVGWWLATALVPKELLGALGWSSLIGSLPMLVAVIVGLIIVGVASGLFAAQRIIRQDPFLLVLRN